MTDHSALIERLEATKRAVTESGGQINFNDTVLVNPDGPEAAAALRDQQARIDDAEKATRWAYKALERYDDALGLNTDEAALIALYLCKDFCEGRPSITRPLPSAPNQAKEAGE